MCMRVYLRERDRGLDRHTETKTYSTDRQKDKRETERLGRWGRLGWGDGGGGWRWGRQSLCVNRSSNGFDTNIPCSKLMASIHKTCNIQPDLKEDLSEITMFYEVCYDLSSVKGKIS